MNDLQTILDAYLDDELTVDQHRQLAEWMDQCPDNIDRLVKECCLDSYLQDALRQGDCPHLPERPGGCFARAPTEGWSGTVPFFPSGGALPAGGLFPAAVAYFSSGWPVAYLAATAILGTALLIGSVIPVSGPQQIATQSLRLPSPAGRGTGDEGGGKASSVPQVVARITGMVDCQWEKKGTDPICRNGPEAGTDAQRWSSHKWGQSPFSPQDLRPKTPVSLGDQFALASGLMEITYDTGATVILQGPVTYEVESKDGGFLSLGKLTGKLETKAPDPRPKTADPSSFILHPSSFVIRTPTATVTDLGTEFGVEVDRQGDTKSHVFCGSVKLQVLDAGEEKQGSAVVLREGEAAQTQRSRNDGGTSIVMRRISSDPKLFVRRLVRTPRTLDLLDIVAGGSGTGHRRERGIDPVTGMEDPMFVSSHHKSTGQYQPAVWYKLIDGVFIPNGEAGPVALDSAGHTFDRFPHTAGETVGSIWSRAATVKADSLVLDADKYWIYAMGHGEQYMPRRFGLLCLHANTGITFNLEAMRRIHRGVQPARFRALAGVARELGLADVWVFVDGRLKFERRQFRMKDGPVSVEIGIDPNDRFLTLVSTDCGGSVDSDWVVFGDPVLETSTIERGG